MAGVNVLTMPGLDVLTMADFKSIGVDGILVSFIGPVGTLGGAERSLTLAKSDSKSSTSPTSRSAIRFFDESKSLEGI